MTPRARRSNAHAEGERRASTAGALGLEQAISAADDEEEVELAACWAQEALLRGHSVADIPRALPFWERLQRDGHPLARLPLVLMEAEALVQDVLPNVAPGGGRAWSAPEHPTRSVRAVGRPGLSVSEVAPSSEQSAELRAAVAGWEAESNGILEVREFTVIPLVAALDANLIAALDLWCLRGATEFSCDLIGVAPAVRTLLGAAANGGAYGGALGGAYGRLAAWRTLGALAGAPRFATIEVAQDVARECQWASFFAPGWFQGCPEVPIRR